MPELRQNTCLAHCEILCIKGYSFKFTFQFNRNLKNVKPTRKEKNLSVKSGSQLGFALAAGIIAALAYSPALKGDFVWDDELYVSGNPLMGDLSLNGLKNIFSTFVSGNYHPLTILSLALEFPFAGKSTMIFHLSNLILHGLNTVLLWLLLAEKIRLGKPQVILITLLFALHPMHAESVAWISERKDVLYAFFYLLGLHAALSGDSLNKRLLMVLFFIASAMSKAVAVTFPIVWLLAEYYRNPENIKAWLQKEKLWTGLLLLLSLGTGILAIKAQDTSIRDYQIYTLLDNFFIGSYALLFYPVKTLIPAGLSAFYPYPEKTGILPPFQFLIAPVMVAVWFFLAWKFRKKLPEIFQGSLLYLVLILPVAQFLPVGNAVAADRYAYLASWGLGWILCAVFRIPGFSADQTARIRIAGTAVFILLFVLTWQRSKVWLSTETLWEDIIEKEPGVPLSYYNLGNYYLDKKQAQKAIPYFEKARSINPKQNLHPNYTHSWNNLANAHMQLKNYAEAEKIYREVTRMDSSYTGAYVNLGNLYNETGQYDKAIKVLNQALQMQPAHSGIRMNLALAHLQAQKYTEALAMYESLCRDQPNDPMMQHQAALTLASMGRPAEAVERYKICLRMDNNLHIARMNMAVALNQQGKSDSAVLLLREAARGGYVNAQEALRNNGLEY